MKINKNKVNLQLAQEELIEEPRCSSFPSAIEVPNYLAGYCQMAK
jgi:hypothetical protein